MRNLSFYKKARRKSVDFKKNLFLCLKTIKSLNRREEIICSLLAVFIIISGYFSYKNFSASDLSLIDQLNSDSKKIYTEGLIGQIKRLNPVFSDLNPVDRDINQLLFSGLSKYDPRSKTFVEDLATHTLSVDKKTYTFTIKPNIFWHDDVPVTADDIYFTYVNVIQQADFNNPILKANFQGIVIKKTDQNTISFTLKEANSFFFSNLTVGLLPSHLLKDVKVADLEKNDFNLNPVGTGPYKIKEAVKIDKEKNTVILESFAKYYDKKPLINLLKFITFSNKDDLIKAKNSLHGISKITEPEFLQNLREDTRFNLYKYTLPQYTAIFLNTKNPILQDKKVRLSIQKAISSDELLKIVENKRSVFTPILELDQNQWEKTADIDAAKKLLYDAGWFLAEKDSLVRHNDKGQKLDLTLIRPKYGDNNPYLEQETDKVSQFIKKSLGEISLNLNIEAINTADIQTKIKNRQYDLLLYGESLGYNFDTYFYWHSSQADLNGLNLSNYSSPLADSLIEDLRAVFGENNLKQNKLEKLAKIIDNDVPAVFLYTPVYFFAADSKISNIELSNLAFPSDRFRYITEWEFNK